MKIGQRVKTEYGLGIVVDKEYFRNDEYRVGVKLDNFKGNSYADLFKTNILYFFKNEIEPVNSLDPSPTAILGSSKA